MKKNIKIKIISFYTIIIIILMAFTSITNANFQKNHLLNNKPSDKKINVNLTIVEIIQPKQNMMYINGLPIKLGSLIIGNITVIVSATSLLFIDKIEFYIDNKLKHTEEERLTWLLVPWNWDETIFLKHKLKVIAYDKTGGTATDEMDVWIFNI
jgi:hypothetical protein